MAAGFLFVEMRVLCWTNFRLTQRLHRVQRVPVGQVSSVVRVLGCDGRVSKLRN